jgi:ABC-type lipoprotein export system ATPase subunit
MATIEICNLRNIRKLRFDIPDRGVWLLTAANGAGKTSLLGCIRRIGQPNAFPVHFPSSLRSARLDNHAEGSVTYEIGADKVEYAYRGERWTPRPRRNSNLLDQLGYPSVVYVGANADRITPRPEDFNTRNVRPASRTIIDGANEIFETDKFSQLKTINLTRGAGNAAFVLALGGNPVMYHSEKHFSLGELCVLKLLRVIGEVENNSLIIVDELEMALHPRAQVSLLKYIDSEATKKRLTVIFSTHSVSLIKTIDRRKIIYLDRNETGEIRSVVGCYPTYALGNIASDEETLPDAMLYVEDLYARDMLHAFFELFADDQYADPTLRPTAKIVPVGGFNEVVAFLDRNRAVLPARVVQKAVLDEDVSTEILQVLRANRVHAQLAKFQRVEDDILYLPFTPEVGLMNEISANLQTFEQALRTRFGDNQLRIREVVNGYDAALGGGPLRKSAKQASDALLTYLEQQTQKSRDSAREHVCAVFATQTWCAHRAAMLQLLGPMFR